MGNKASGKAASKQPRDALGRFLSPKPVPSVSSRPRTRKPAAKPVVTPKKVVKKVVKKAAPKPAPKTPRKQPAKALPKKGARVPPKPAPKKAPKPGSARKKPLPKPVPKKGAKLPSVPASPTRRKPAPKKVVKSVDKRGKKKPVSPAPVPKKKKKPAPKPTTKPVAKKPRKPRKPRVPTTDERREVFYRGLTPEERKKLERRGNLTYKAAYREIGRVIDKVAAHYFYSGFPCVPARVGNGDETIDADCLVDTKTQMFESDNQVVDFRSITSAIPRIIRTLSPEIWFSMRVHFEVPEAVDEDGDGVIGTLEFDRITSNLLDDDYVLAEHRWKAKVIQTAWQHTRGKLYNNIVGAGNAAENALKKNSEYNPVITFFTFKLCWNPNNVTPGKFR